VIEVCIEETLKENRKKIDEELLPVRSMNWPELTVLFNLSNWIIPRADNRTGGRLKCLTKRGTGVRPCCKFN